MSHRIQNTSAQQMCLTQSPAIIFYGLPGRECHSVILINHFTSHIFCPPQVEQPLRSKKCVWQKLLSKQRKRAVVACFRMAPLYNLPRYYDMQLHLECLQLHNRNNLNGFKMMNSRRLSREQQQRKLLVTLQAEGKQCNKCCSITSMTTLPFSQLLFVPSWVLNLCYYCSALLSLQDKCLAYSCYQRGEKKGTLAISCPAAL